MISTEQSSQTSTARDSKGDREDGTPLTVRMENRPCPLCGTYDDDWVLTGHDRLHGLPGTFQIVKCRHCHLMRTNPRPTAATIGFYYPDDYRPFARVDTRKSSISDGKWKTLAKTLVQFNTQRIPHMRPGRMLEIGCASGAFLRKMRAEGWWVEGLEFSEPAAAKARELGLAVITGRVETAPEPAQPYDLITGWMVVEHLHEPLVALKRLHSWTRPGGHLAFSVPNANAHEFRLFQDRWYACQIPTHLFHYTPETIKHILERSGWELERIFHQRVVTNLVVSSGYALADEKPDSLVASKLMAFENAGLHAAIAMYPIAWLLGVFGQTGRMTVWARRQE